MPNESSRYSLLNLVSVLQVRSPFGTSPHEIKGWVIAQIWLGTFDAAVNADGQRISRVDLLWETAHADIKRDVIEQARLALSRAVFGLRLLPIHAAPPSVEENHLATIADDNEWVRNGSWIMSEVALRDWGYFADVLLSYVHMTIDDFRLGCETVRMPPPRSWFTGLARGAKVAALQRCRSAAPAILPEPNMTKLKFSSKMRIIAPDISLRQIDALWATHATPEQRRPGRRKQT